jgi:hypothetical protein
MRGDLMAWRVLSFWLTIAAVAASGCRSAPYERYDLSPPADLAPPADLVPADGWACGREGQPCIPGGADSGCTCRVYSCMRLPVDASLGVCVLAGP